MAAWETRRAALGAVTLVLFLSAMDQTIVGTALPRIAAELAGLHWYAWVFTVYMLASTITVPIVGKLGDLHGRKGVLLAGLAIFLVAALLAGSAGNMLVLVIARGVQGIGSGCIAASAFAVVGDLFPPAERGRYAGLLGGAYALASVMGPILGGAVVDHWSWRGVFLINLPLGLVAAAVLVFALPGAPRRSGDRELDWAGAASLAGAVVPLMLAFATGGHGPEAAVRVARWPALVVSALMLAVFVAVERRAKEPLVPLSLFRHRVFAVSLATVLVSSPALYVGSVFIPLFMQDVLRSSATAAGLALMPMVLGLMVGNVVSGQVVTRTGVYRWLTVAGLVITSAGTYPLSRLSAATTPRAIMAYMALVGLGFGLMLPALTLAAQNAVEHRHLGVSTSLAQFARTLSGTLGVALSGTLLARRLHEGLAPAVSGIFLLATGALLAGAILTIFLRDLPLRRANEPDAVSAAEVAMEGGEHEP